MFVRTALLCIALGAAAFATADAAPAAPLRSLTFAVVYTVTTMQDNHISGLTGDPNKTLGPQSGMSEQHGFAVDDSGTMRIDVIAATTDGGLVTDVAFDGKVTHQPVIRVAITKDGRLLYDPKLALSMQAARVLPLLARGMFGNRELAAGVSWSDPAAAPAHGATSYVVKSVDAPRVTVAVTTTIELAGPQGFDEHDDGTLTFATDVLAPLRWDLLAHLRRGSVQGTEVTDSHLTATLTGDTFAKKPNG